MSELLTPPLGPQANQKSGLYHQPMREAAEKLDATFLAEMLKAAGFGEQENSFSGGTGEAQ
ncbi:MAG: chemotaxis protein chel, partial [Pseudomonadota bacterium]